MFFESLSYMYKKNSLYLLLMLLHERELVLQLLQHLHLGGLEVCSVGPQVI